MRSDHETSGEESLGGLITYCGEEMKGRGVGVSLGSLPNFHRRDLPPEQAVGSIR